LRIILTLIGALAGLCGWALAEAWAESLLPERVMLFLSAGGLAFFAGVLVMAGPLGVARAAAAAGATALMVAGLVTWGAARNAEAGGLYTTGGDGVAGLVLGTLPWPFWIAWFRGNWADHPTHFRESWSVVIRVAAGLVFTGMVWGLIWLSDALLSLVGLDIIERLVEVDPVPWGLTGAVTGLALAVVGDLDEVLSPDLLLRLLRLLVPVVAGVMAVFLVALPWRGFDTVLGGLSVAGTLLAMAGVAVMLVAAVCDPRDEAVAAGPVVVRAGQGLAAMVIVLAGLAVWALSMRVGQAGWTPPRVAGAAVCSVALGYGLGHLWALAGGGAWRARLRRANLGMALAMLALAALWLTPVLDATRIAAASQVGRYVGGRLALDRLDLAALEGWGTAGAAALARLEKMAEAPEQAALAARLADRDAWGQVPAPSAELRGALLRLLPVLPPGGAGEAAEVVASLPLWQLRNWQAACGRRLADGRAACALVIADFWQGWPPAGGPASEAMFLWVAEGGWLEHQGLVREEGAGWRQRLVLADPGGPVEDGAAALAALLDGGPVLEPVPAQRLRLGRRGLSIGP
jgi:hypothetical protein